VQKSSKINGIIILGKAFYHMGVMKMERDWLKKLRVEDSDQEIVFTVKMYICD
jgi:hypothetical protein